MTDDLDPACKPDPTDFYY